MRRRAYTARLTSAAGRASVRKAPVAQLDRASVYGTEGRAFESLRVRLLARRQCSVQVRNSANRIVESLRVR